MEYAKDEIFNLNYTKGIIKKKRTSYISKTIKRNKLVQLVIGITFILCMANIVFIYNFFSILSKM